jgi:Ca2+/Na+ antiporter
MFGLPELIMIFYLVVIAFWIAGIVVAIRIKEKKALYILLAVLSLPVLMFLNKGVSTVVICALQISIFFYMKKIKNRTFQTEGDKK